MPTSRGRFSSGRYTLIGRPDVGVVTLNLDEPGNVGRRTYLWVHKADGTELQVHMAELRAVEGTPAIQRNPEQPRPAKPVKTAANAPLRADPMTVLKRDREQAIRMASDVGVARAQVLLRKAQADLNKRLRTAEGLHGPDDAMFSQVQMRVTLEQVEHVMKGLTGGLKTQLVDQATGVSDAAASGVLRYMDASERKFAGINERLPIREATLLDRARSGSASSLLNRLQGDPKAGPGILHRYGDSVINRFEEQLQVRFLTRKPWGETRTGLINESPFLQGAPAHWAERIVRTEIQGVHGRAAWEATREANAQLGDVVKILCATFDARTGSDSYAVHGQIRRPAEAFEWWEGKYMHPPNRPNDREIVVSHRMSWPIPDGLKPRTDGEVAARWHYDGRKGSPPPRPNMSTVPRSEFGKAEPARPAAAPAAAQAPAAAPAREATPTPRQAAAEARADARAAASVQRAERQAARAAAAQQRAAAAAARVTRWEIHRDGQPTGTSAPSRERMMQDATRYGQLFPGHSWTVEPASRAEIQRWRGVEQQRVREQKAAERARVAAAKKVAAEREASRKANEKANRAAAKAGERPVLSPDTFLWEAKAAGVRVTAEDLPRFNAVFQKPLREGHLETLFATKPLRELGKLEGRMNVHTGYAELHQEVNEGSKEIAQMERTYKRVNGKSVVEHDYFKIRDDSKLGSGVGKQVLKDQVSTYRQLGVDRVELGSAWIGRWYWPSIGFEPQHPGDFATRKARFLDWVKRDGKTSPEALKAIEGATSLHEISLAADPAQQVPAKLYDSDGRHIGTMKDKDGKPLIKARSLGKEWMLESREYHGDKLVLPLHDGDPGFERFKQRVGLHDAPKAKKP